MVYSNFLAIYKKSGYRSMNPKQLAKLTGYKEGLFKDNGTAPIFLTGLKLDAMKEKYGKYSDVNVTVTTQWKMRGETLAYLIQNHESFEELKIYQDFQQIFPSLFSEMKKKRVWKKQLDLQ